MSSKNDSRFDLSENELEFYSRQIVLSELGYNAQVKLKKSKVCVLGLGGLGSPVSTQLAAMGVGYLRLVDRDIVELSNLHRQHIYSVNQLGYPKVEVASERIQNLNPYIEVEPLPVSISQDTAEQIIADMDLVVDGLDSIEPRYAINRACIKLEIPYVFGAAITTLGNTSTIIPGETPCLECFYGNLSDENLPSCGVVGVHPSILSLIASVEVSESIRILIGRQPKLSNKLLYCDIENLTFDVIQLAKAEKCPVCGIEPDKPPQPLSSDFVEETCSRNGERVFVIAPKKILKIELKSLNKRLKDIGLKIKLKTKMSTTFTENKKNEISILESGIMILKGIENKKEAVSIYESIIGDEK